jgi:YbgC/YbaW family acyl-CoA thioester hydrolase
MSAFLTTQKVRFGHVDPAGIAYFPRIYDYLHEAFEELWERHVGARYYHLLLERKMGFPLVHAEVEFRRPLRFGDEPEVAITCFRLGTTSLGLRYLYRVRSELCLEARMTTVCVHTKTMKSQPLPPEFRARFAELLEEPR